MAEKKKIAKNARQKKVLQMVNEAHMNDNKNSELQDSRHDEDALRRQFLLIKKDYNKLMTDVVEGYGIIKHWVGLQTANKGELLKSRFIKN